MAQYTETAVDRLVVRKLIPATCQEVFDAWTDAEGMRHWMCPGKGFTAEAVLDPRVGGSFRIVMKGAQRDYEHIGEYQVVDRPHKLAFTWISDGTDHQPTLVTVEFFDRSGQCELVLTHERFPKADKVADHKKGWTEIIEHLAEYVAR